MQEPAIDQCRDEQQPNIGICLWGCARLGPLRALLHQATTLPSALHFASGHHHNVSTKLPVVVHGGLRHGLRRKVVSHIEHPFARTLSWSGLIYHTSLCSHLVLECGADGCCHCGLQLWDAGGPEAPAPKGSHHLVMPARRAHAHSKAAIDRYSRSTLPEEKSSQHQSTSWWTCLFTSLPTAQWATFGCSIKQKGTMHVQCMHKSSVIFFDIAVNEGQLSRAPAEDIENKEPGKE